MGTANEPPASDEPTPAQLEAGAATFGMLSTPIRLHLMWLLCHGEHDVGWLAGQAGTSVAAVSQQLGKLRLACRSPPAGKAATRSTPLTIRTS